METPASPTLLYIGDRWKVRKNRFQWKVGAVVETGKLGSWGSQAALYVAWPWICSSEAGFGQSCASPFLWGLHLDGTQFLWTGLKLDTMGQFHLRDEELASTRPGRRLTLFLRHWVPSTLAGTERQLRQWHQAAPLSPASFQQLLLTGVACVYRLHAALEGEERARWAELFSLLGQEILQDLCKDHCPQGQTPLLSPWAFPSELSQQHSSP
uniref:Family with sequence similarity 180 member B n=1 Tax=Vombatus ursinus TaxID=29139 RepID=A0A4X2KRN3_VOMUR